MRFTYWVILLQAGLLFTTICIFCGRARASPKRCEWVDTAPREDRKSRYYLGVASNAQTETAGIAEALNAGWESALRENFGMFVQVSRQIIADMNKTQLFHRVSEDSDEVQMIEFLETKRCILESDNHRFNVWLLFKYSREEIEKERKRLAAVKKLKKAPVEFSLSGFNKPGVGAIEFETRPYGAKVFIDGEQYGRTPLRVSGILALGKHTYRIDHPSFEPVSGKFLIGATVVRVHHELKPAFGEVVIKTNPASATVMVNGKPAGVTPTNRLKLEANVSFTISISHPEAEAISLQIAVERDSVTERVIPLFLKPGQLSVFSAPDGATVSVNGHVIGVTPLSARTLPAGIHSLTVTRDGYEEESRDITLRGNEHHEETFKLRHRETSRFSSAERKPSSYDADSRPSNTSTSEADLDEVFGRVGEMPWIFGVLSFGATGTTFEGPAASDSYYIGMSLERRLFRRIGLMYEFDALSDSDNVTGRSSTWGLPIYFGSVPGEGFFIMPEIKTVDAKFSIRSKDYGPRREYSTSQSGTGISAGVNFFGDAHTFGDFRFGIGIRGGSYGYSDTPYGPGSTSRYMSVNFFMGF